jgi:hypothetical protein
MESSAVPQQGTGASYTPPVHLRRLRMRIDGHTDTPTGKIFHIQNKTALSSAMWTALDFLTWDTRIPLVKPLQDAGWKKIQAILDGVSTDPSWGRGMDIETDVNGKTIMEFFDDYSFRLELNGFPIKVDNLFFYLSQIFHNDEMYREKIGWAVEEFLMVAYSNPMNNGILDRLIPRIRPDIIPPWFIYDRPSVWTDDDYIEIFTKLKEKWDEYDLRENRKKHIKLVFDVFVRLFERNESFRESTKEMLAWWKDKEWFHEEWFDPMLWYPRTRGGIHYGVHGGIL